MKKRGMPEIDSCNAIYESTPRWLTTVEGIKKVGISVDRELVRDIYLCTSYIFEGFVYACRHHWASGILDCQKYATRTPGFHEPGCFRRSRAYLLFPPVAGRAVCNNQESLNKASLLVLRDACSSAGRGTPRCSAATISRNRSWSASVRGSGSSDRIAAGHLLETQKQLEGFCLPWTSSVSSLDSSNMARLARDGPGPPFGASGLK